MAERMMRDKKRIIVGASGASGFPVLKKCLELIREDRTYQSGLIMSRNADLTLKAEMGETPESFGNLADLVFDSEDIAAGPASGTWRNTGMLIAPCSMKTLAGIHAGLSDNLLLRAADVTMKEHRTLVLGVRETPLGPVHLRNMYEMSMMPEVRIVPLMMSFYFRPETIDEMVFHMAAKLLEPFGIDVPDFHRWKEEDD